MATCRRTGTNENVATYGNNTRDYDGTNSEMPNWEAATDNDLVTATQSEVLECYDDAASFDDYCVLDGATCNSSYFRIVRPAGTIGEGSWEGHDGTPDNGVNWDGAGNSNYGMIFVIKEAYSHFQDLIAKTTCDYAGTYGTFFHNINVQPGYYIGCIAHDGTNANGSNNIHGFMNYNGHMYCINCLTENNDGHGFEGTGDTNYWYNCTGTNNGGDNFNGAAGGYLKNCLGYNAVGDDFDNLLNNVQDDGIDHCASSDDNADDGAMGSNPVVKVRRIVDGGTSDGGDVENHLDDADVNFPALSPPTQVGMRVKNVANISYANITAVADGDCTLDADIFDSDTDEYDIGAVYINCTFTFEDGANNFKLAAADTGARGRGCDLSADANYAFDDDILGNTRSAWDIGFHEYQAPAGGAAPTGVFYGPLVGPLGGPI